MKAPTVMTIFVFLNLNAHHPEQTYQQNLETTNYSRIKEI